MSMPHVDTVLVPRIPRVPVITSLSFSFSGKPVECGGLPAVRDGAGARVTLRVAD